eukprot:Nitzschia sp. Nitz4//scaffold87_size112219//85104//86906//NITZ4_004084-RA/size112219-processed-gene-0.141-mRNA-1//-1//CDS//3329559399//6182//frame0
MVAVHGLALSIRSATESETFDLGGMSVASIEAVMRDAFSQGFALPEDQAMIRLTFLVGAGKQARQKYDPQAQKIVTTTLQELGFQEDRGASCIPECAGSFKMQHDTGKNLKTVVVFPKLQQADPSADGTSGDGVSDEEALFPPNSIEAKIAYTSLGVFTNMVQSKCQTWTQKKALLQRLDDPVRTTLAEIESILMKPPSTHVKGTPLLSPAQQAFYNDCRDLDDKRSVLQEKIQSHIDQGKVTSEELKQLREHVSQRIATLQQQQQSSSKHNPQLLAKAQERQQKLRDITSSISLPKLQHHAELGKLWKQLVPLQSFLTPFDMTLGADESQMPPQNQLLSVHDTQLLGRKDELIDQIRRLEQTSRGWLEDDDMFWSRVMASRQEHCSKFGIRIGASAGSSKYGASSKDSSGGSSLITSDTKVKVPITKWSTPISSKDAHSNNKGKKKKKKKGKKKSAQNDDAVLDEAMARNAKLKQEEKEKQEKLHPPNEYGVLTVPIAMLTETILPILMAVLTWILTLILGRPKQSKSKKS